MAYTVAAKALAIRNKWASAGTLELVDEVGQGLYPGCSEAKMHAGYGSEICWDRVAIL